MRDVERVIDEAIALAAQRGGVVAGVTLATRDPSAATVMRVRKLLARHGVTDVDIVLEESERPMRIIALEISRT